RLLLRLRLCCARIRPTACLIWVYFRDVTKRIDRSLWSVGILVQQPKVEPRMRIVGIAFDRLFQQLLRRFNAREIQQRNSLIQLRNLQLGIECGCILKRFQPFFKELLIHVCGAEIVEPGCFGGFIRRTALSWSGSDEGKSNQNDTTKGEEESSHHAT